MGKGEQSLTTVMEHHGDEEITENSSRLKRVKNDREIYPKPV